MKDLKLDPPPNFKLATLFKFCKKHIIVNAHRTESNIAATTAIFQHKQFFKERKEIVFNVLDNATIYANGSLQPTKLETDFNEASAGSQKKNLTQSTGVQMQKYKSMKKDTFKL